MNSDPGYQRRRGDPRSTNVDQTQANRRQSGERRGALLIAFGIMWVAITGYYIGLSAPMSAEQDPYAFENVELRIEWPSEEPVAVIPATTYAEMPAARTSANHAWATRLETLRQEASLGVVIQANHAQKRASLATRQQLRAFNGAPPTIPHPIDQMTSLGCLACHGDGIKTRSLRASKMPHPFYANCTQCHVEHESQHAAAIEFRENTFVGLAAPQSGPRAHETAPPLIPHTTWLRDDCLSCHGRTASPGMETTHPWRRNCLQCHGSSSQLEQMNTVPTPQFLPPPTLEKSDE